MKFSFFLLFIGVSFGALNPELEREILEFTLLFDECFRGSPIFYLKITILDALANKIGMKEILENGGSLTTICRKTAIEGLVKSHLESNYHRNLDRSNYGPASSYIL